MNFGGESEKTSEDLEQVYNILDFGFSQRSGNSQLGGSRGFMKKIIPMPVKDDSSNHFDT
jgi:hypothetical protein